MTRVRTQTQLLLPCLWVPTLHVLQFLSNVALSGCSWAGLACDTVCHHIGFPAT